MDISSRKSLERNKHLYEKDVKDLIFEDINFIKRRDANVK